MKEEEEDDDDDDDEPVVVRNFAFWPAGENPCTATSKDTKRINAQREEKECGMVLARSWSEIRALRNVNFPWSDDWWWWWKECKSINRSSKQSSKHKKKIFDDDEWMRPMSLGESQPRSRERERYLRWWMVDPSQLELFFDTRIRTLKKKKKIGGGGASVSQSKPTYSRCLVCVYMCLGRINIQQHARTHVNVDK